MVWPITQIREWKERQAAMREMRHLAEEEAQRLVFDDNNPVNLAKIALSLNNSELALTHWRDAVVRVPFFAKTHKDALDILLHLRLYDEAETIMKEGMHLYPAEPHYAGGYAEVAETRRDLPEALARWKQVMKRYPNWWKAHVHYAIMLSATDQPDQADAVLNKAATLFPSEVLVGIEWARNAVRRTDNEMALARWQQVWDQTKHGVADVGIADALMALGRLEEAEQRLIEAKPRSPLAVEVYMKLAHVARQRGDNEEAVRRWDEVKRRFPLLRFGYDGEIRLLGELGRFNEAEQVILQAKERFPSETWPAEELRTNSLAREQAAQIAG
jgi:tetratricopeptide (TPR) repeat protein